MFVVLYNVSAGTGFAGLSMDGSFYLILGFICACSLIIEVAEQTFRNAAYYISTCISFLVWEHWSEWVCTYAPGLDMTFDPVWLMPAQRMLGLEKKNNTLRKCPIPRTVLYLSVLFLGGRWFEARHPNSSDDSSHGEDLAQSWTRPQDDHIPVRRHGKGRRWVWLMKSGCGIWIWVWQCVATGRKKVGDLIFWYGELKNYSRVESLLKSFVY